MKVCLLQIKSCVGRDSTHQPHCILQRRQTRSPLDIAGLGGVRGKESSSYWEKGAQNRSTHWREQGREGGRKAWASSAEPQAYPLWDKGAVGSGHEQHSFLVSAAATSASQAQGAVLKRGAGAAPCRTALSVACRTGTPNPACHPHQT